MQLAFLVNSMMENTMVMSFYGFEQCLKTSSNYSAGRLGGDGLLEVESEVGASRAGSLGLDSFLLFVFILLGVRYGVRSGFVGLEKRCG